MYLMSIMFSKYFKYNTIKISEIFKIFLLVALAYNRYSLNNAYICYLIKH